MRRMLSAIMILVAVAADAASPIPDGKLAIAVRQKEGGRVGQSVHLLELTCIEGACDLLSVSLNQCLDFMGGVGFFPKAERSSTRAGNLKVRTEPGALLVEETGDDMGGAYVTTLRFGYRPDRKWVHEVTSFSGAFIKKSDLLKKVISIEYVPLPDPSQIVKLECGVRLPGLAR